MSILPSLGRTEQLHSVLSLLLFSAELWLNELEQIIITPARNLGKKNYLIKTCFN